VFDQVWDPESGNVVFSLRGHTDIVYSLSCFASSSFPFHPRIVTASRDGTARLWDGEDGSCLSCWQGSMARSVAYHRGRGGDRDVLVLGTEEGLADVEEACPAEGLRPYQEANRQVTSMLAYETPEGPFVVSISRAAYVIIWDGEARTLSRSLEVGTPPTCSHIVGTPDGRWRLILGLGDGQVEAWDLAEMRTVESAPPPKSAMKTG
jgi:WD40 repeat protein